MRHEDSFYVGALIGLPRIDVELFSRLGCWAVDPKQGKLNQ